MLCFNEWWAQGGQLEIFSSETGRWVEHSLRWEVDTDKLSATMHFFDGVLYLLAQPRHIACFDLENMSCSLIELPEELKHDASLGNSGGFLHCTMNDANELRIWVLKGLKWALKSRVSISWILEWNGECRDLVSNAYLHHGLFNFLAFHPKEEVVYLWVMGKLVSYDLGTKRFGLVCELGAEKEKVQMIQICLFPYSDHVSNCSA